MSKAFSVFLQDLQDGRTHSELSSKMAELLDAVRSTGRAGEIVLAIKGIADEVQEKSGYPMLFGLPPSVK